MAADALTHVDARGAARMVDTSAKHETLRVAEAACKVVMQPATLDLILEGAVAKGDVLACARVAGIMAAKETPRLIPLCHPLPLTEVVVDLTPGGSDALEVRARVTCYARTGVEMEAMTAACVAALTVYDMCKAVDRGMHVEHVRLLRKQGGRSGTWRAAEVDAGRETDV